MNRNINILKLVALSFFVLSGVNAQQKLSKLSQSVSVDKEVTIDLNTSYCNIIFDTWNKNTIEIEAYIEGDNLNKEELQEALKNWNVDVKASKNLVTITTKGNAPQAWAFSNSGDSDAVRAVLEELKFELADLPDMDFDFHFVMPEIPQMPNMPEMPELPELPKDASHFHFDYDAYKKNGEKYLKEYTKNFESKYGEDYARKMEAWGEKFGKEWGEKYAKDMTKWAEKFDGAWAEKYGEKMAAWGERYAEQMEERNKRMQERQDHIEKHQVEREKMAREREKLAGQRKVLVEKMVNKTSSSKIIKTIKIKMPKDAKLKVNVRHGELKFASNIENLRAELSHTKLIAQSINGSRTSINASYSPIYVTNWNLGELKLNYVDQANLDNVKQMVLTSNSSNINIQNLSGNAIIDSNIGDLKILKIDDSFTNLNIIFQNGHAMVTLPKVSHNLQYKGERTRFSHPEKMTKENIPSFNTPNSNTGKTIVVNAKYSNVVMQ